LVVVMICLSILAARKKKPGLSLFRAPGGKALPAAIMIVIVACYVPNILAGGWFLWACTFAYFAVGIVIYVIGARARRIAPGTHIGASAERPARVLTDPAIKEDSNVTYSERTD